MEWREGEGGREEAERNGFSPISRNSYQEMEMTDKARHVAPPVFNVTLNPPSPNCTGCLVEFRLFDLTFFSPRSVQCFCTSFSFMISIISNEKESTNVFATCFFFNCISSLLTSKLMILVRYINCIYL